MNKQILKNSYLSVLIALATVFAIAGLMMIIDGGTYVGQSSGALWAESLSLGASVMAYLSVASTIALVMFASIELVPFAATGISAYCLAGIASEGFFSPHMIGAILGLMVVFSIRWYTAYRSVRLPSAYTLAVTAIIALVLYFLKAV